MIPLGWDEVEALGLGELRGRPEDGVVSRVHDDSRDARAGDLFVALNTGVRFIPEALERGAATLVPDDQEAALAALAGLVRGRSNADVVAVVGSTGKTTTKDALGALCGAVTPTVAAAASKNNELGLPLTVLRLEVETRVLVTEMGMRGLGQIAELCAIAQPTLALVTSIGPEHLELVGSLEDVARANAEAVDALPAGGIAIVPAGEPLLEPYLRDDVDVRRFDRGAVERDGELWRFGVAGEELRLELPFTQRHLAENVLAALTAYTPSVSRSTGRAREPRASGCRRGAARSTSSGAAGSSSTTHTTRTPPRCGRRSSTSPSARKAGAASSSSAGWRSWATRARATTPRSRSCSTSSGSSSWSRSARTHLPT